MPLLLAGIVMLCTTLFFSIGVHLNPLHAVVAHPAEGTA
jgi:hypothetical protein